MQGRIELSLDGTKWFKTTDREARERFAALLPGTPGYRRKRKDSNEGLMDRLVPSVTSLRLNQSTQIEVTASDTVGFTGVALSKSGRGGGYMMGTYHRTISERLWGMISIAAGSNNFVSLRTGGRWVEQFDCSCAANFPHPPTTAPPLMELSATRPLGVGLNGSITYRTGPWYLFQWGKRNYDGPEDSVELAIRRQTKSNGTQASITAGVAESSLSVKHTVKATPVLSVNASGEISTVEGASITMGVQRDLFSRKNRIGAALQCSLGGQMTLKLR